MVAYRWAYRRRDRVAGHGISVRGDSVSLGRTATGRGDLIGGGGDALIPATPPREAIALPRKDASERFSWQYVHTVPGVEKRKRAKKQSRNEAGTGYRREAQERVDQRKRIVTVDSQPFPPATRHE